MNVPRQPRRHLTAPPWRTSRPDAQVPVDVGEGRDTADDRGSGDVIFLSPDEVEQALDVFPVERAPVLLVNEAPPQEIAGTDAILELPPPDEYAVGSRELLVAPAPQPRRFLMGRTLPRQLNRPALMFALIVGLGGLIGVAIYSTWREVQPRIAQAPALAVPVDTTAKVTTSAPPGNKVVEPLPEERRATPESTPPVAAIAAKAEPTRPDLQRPVTSEQQQTAEPAVRTNAPEPVARAIAPSIADAALPIAANVPVVIPDPVPPAPPAPAAPPTPAPRAVETLPSPAEPVAAPPNVAAASPEPTPVEPLSPPRLTETGAIHNVLKQYQSAFNDLDTHAAREIWPSVDSRALDRAFAQLEAQQLEFDRCDIDVNGVRAVAACGGRTRYVPKLGNKNPQAQRRQWTFDLRKVNDAWLIEGVDSR